jgi:hypothetical protein
MRRAKILATLGPASNTPEVLDSMINAGLNAVRINMSHGTHEEHAETIKSAKAAAKKTSALSNIKQVSLGVIMYMGDYDDVFPQGKGNCWWGPADGDWIEDTKPYIKSLPLFRDPSDPLNTGGWRSEMVPGPSYWGTVPISFVRSASGDPSV